MEPEMHEEVHDEEDMDVEDLAESNQVLISALIELLVKKGVITQDELDAETEDIQAEDEDEDDDEEEVAPQPSPQPTPQPQAPSQPPPQAPPSQPQPSPSPSPGVPPQRPGL